MNTRPLTLDIYNDPPSRSQTESFKRVEAGMKAKYGPQFETLTRVALRLAAERGRFTSEEVLEEAGGRLAYPRNLIGAVIGALRSRHAICVIDRVKTKHREAKGRWISVFRINSEAIRVDG